MVATVAIMAKLEKKPLIQPFNFGINRDVGCFWSQDTAGESGPENILICVARARKRAIIKVNFKAQRESFVRARQGWLNVLICLRLILTELAEHCGKVWCPREEHVFMFWEKDGQESGEAVD